MSARNNKKKNIIYNFFKKFHKRRLKRLKTRLRWKTEETKLKNEIQQNSHSLLWVWEFSKKAVLICFLFYIAVQIYSMTVMVVHCDFTHLGELIIQTGEIVQNCVFAYLVKAGFENVGKIFASKFEYESDEEEPAG